MKNFKETSKQIEALELIAGNTTTLLEGGSRSGKTFIYMRAMAARALHYPGTWHAALRLRFNHAKTSLWLKTLPDVIKSLGLTGRVKMQETDHYAEFPGGSRLFIAGLDDKERVEKILGNEFATLWLNEGSQIDFDSYETLSTRLNPPRGVPARFFVDYNPPSKKHWGYKIFHDRVFPDGRPVPDNDYKFLKMNPQDNAENNAEDYMSRLENLSGRKRKRFLHGEYGDEEGSLWKRKWFKYGKAPADMTRIAIGVDPAGSKTGDEIGIIAAGMKDGLYYVLDDYSMHGTPKEWRDEVVALYDKYKADVVAAEKNYGGDMVESTITSFGQVNINVKMVHASRGKQVRAEPISAMYERGQVIHSKTFTQLEDELCTTKFEDLEDSPNRLDALVWALSELAIEGDIIMRYV